MIKTDIGRLHRVHNFIYNKSRRSGKTVYYCHLVAGYLEVLEHDTIIVLLPYLDRIDHFFSVLRKVFDEHDIKIKHFDKWAYRITFENNTNQVKFMSLQSISRRHPIDAGAHPDQYVISDIDDVLQIPEDLTVSTINKIDQYIELKYHTRETLKSIGAKPTFRYSEEGYPVPNFKFKF